jgi:hypothetical protein
MSQWPGEWWNELREDGFATESPVFTALRRTEMEFTDEICMHFEISGASTSSLDCRLLSMGKHEEYELC